MAKLVLKDAFVEINAVELSDHCESLTINYGAETPESTCMGVNARTRLPGLIDWTVDISFRQDFAASEVDITLFALVGAAAFAIEFRPTTAVASATNPKYTGNALLGSYNPITGTVGDTANAPVTLTGDGLLTRGTAP